MFNINKGLPAWRILSLVVVVVFGILSILGTSNEEEIADPFGIADAGPDQYVESGLGEIVYLDGSGSNTPLGADPGDNSVIYLWEMVGKPAGAQDIFWLSDRNIINPKINIDYDPGEYVIKLTVRHGGHTGIDTVKITAYIEDDEVIPVANAGADIVAKHGALVELNASDSFHYTYHMPLSYTWFMSEQPLDSTSVLSSSEVVNPSFIAEFNENDMDAGRSHYEVRLHVIDENNWVSAPDHVDIYVYPPEGYVHPTPIAGPDQRVSTGTVVNLDGSASHDMDVRPLGYEWQFYSRPQGSQAVLSNANTPTPSFTPDVDGAYVLFLSVDNGEYNSSSDLDGRYNVSIYDRQYQDRVTVFATTSNPRSVSILGTDQQVFYTGPDSLVLDASMSTHPFVYQWQMINKPSTSNASVVISDNNDPNGAQLNYDMEGDYVVRMSAQTSNQAPDYDTIVYKVTTNSPPVADAGADQDVTASFPVTLSGSNSSDTDLDTVAYSWSLVSTPADWIVWPGEWPLLSEGRDASPTFTPILNGDYLFRLTVNDNQASSEAESVTISVSGSMINSPPVADAGPDQPNVIRGVQVALDGRGSSDPDTDPITFLWHVESVPPNSMMWDGSLATPTSEQPVFTPDLEGVYQFSLVVNDGQLDSAADTVNITVTDPVGVCSNPLIQQTSLPYLPGVPETPTIFQVDAAAVDTIRLVSINDPSAATDVSALQASIPDLSQIAEVNFITINVNWTIFSRSHNNPVSDAVSPSFILERQSDNIFFKVDVAFTGSAAFAAVQIDSLTACRCGANAGDCPD